MLSGKYKTKDALEDLGVGGWEIEKWFLNE
jgi:hypothetical protein